MYMKAEVILFTSSKSNILLSYLLEWNVNHCLLPEQGGAERLKWPRGKFPVTVVVSTMTMVMVSVSCVSED